MMDKLQLQNELQTIYFNILTVESLHRPEKILSNLVEQLKTVLPITNGGFYKYNDWYDSFELITANQNVYPLQPIVAGTKLYDHAIENDSYINVSEKVFFNMPLNDISSSIIPIQFKEDYWGFLFISTIANEIITDSLFELIKQETEKLISIITNFEKTEKRNSQHKFLFELSSRLNSMNTKSEILTEIIDAIKSVYPNFSYFLLLSQDHKAENNLPIKTIEYSDDVTKRASAEAFISGIVQIENVQNNEAKVCLYAPLVGKQGVYGVLQIISKEQVQFPDEDVKFIVNFTETSGKAIENVMLYQNSRQLVADLQLINETSHKMNSNLDLLEVTKLVRMQIMDGCHASEVGIIYYKPEMEDQITILNGSTAFFKTKQGKTLVTNLLHQSLEKRDAIFYGDHDEADCIPFRSIMAIPMQHADTIHGLVVILAKDPYFFTFDSFKLMQSLVQHSTLALINTILKEQLEKAVTTDYLTKLYSRNYLDEQINIDMQQGDMGTLILFDIDDFKYVNDTYGHHVGDQVIVQVANLIMQELEEKDIPARWGGEELAVYLPNSNINTGSELANLISKKVAQSTQPRVTLSAGVSTWTNKKNDSVINFFIRADQALYEAKSLGKNCVVKKAY